MSIVAIFYGILVQIRQALALNPLGRKRAIKLLEQL
jgi:hypothetical protein